MAFNLQKVLRALLFSSSQPLSVKDIQNLFARFHEQAPPARPEDEDEENPVAASAGEVPAAGEAPAAAETSAAAEAPADATGAGDADAGQDGVSGDENEDTDEILSDGSDQAGGDQAGGSDQAGDGSGGDANDADSAPAAETAPDRAAAADNTTAPSAAIPSAAEATATSVSAAAASAAVTAAAPSSSSSAPSAADAAEEPAADSPEDYDAELYADVPSLITAAQIREAMDAISEGLRAAADIYLLIEGPAGYRIVTHPRFARWIRILRDEPPPVKLTQSAIETLAIIAYRQPVTRTDIETIRGVSAEAGLNKLLERELIYIMGRADLPGRPLQYGTTDRFLDFVGVKSLVELPASDVLSPRQIDEWLKNAAHVRPPADADMGLPLEEGEGESPNLESVTVDHVETPGEAAAAPPLPRAPIPVAADTAAAANDTDGSTDAANGDEAGPAAPSTEPEPAPPPEKPASPGDGAGDEDGKP